MTPLEMHIEIDLGLQKLASNVRDNITIEEKDWVLNKIQDRYIKKNVKPAKDGSGRFEIDKKCYEDIQELIQPNLEIITYLDSSNRVFGILPDNYMYLISDRSEVIRSCDIGYSIATTTITKYISTLKFNTSTAGSAPYYSVFTITINGATVFDITDYNISSGLNSTNEKFVIMELVIEQLQAQGINVVWEDGENGYSPNSFIITNDIVSTASINVDGITTNATYTTKDYQTFISQKGIERPNRPTRNDILPNLNLNDFHKTIERSPISNLSQNKVYVFYNERFIVNKIVVDIIRKPRKISLILDQSCELVSSTHQELCDLSVEYIKNTIESPSYQTKLQDNQLRME